MVTSIAFLSLLQLGSTPSELDLMVRAFHVPTSEWVLSLQPEDIDYLLELAENEEISPLVRARALGLTTLHRSERIEPRWRKLLNDKAPLIRQEAGWRLIHSAADQTELLSVAAELRSLAKPELELVALDGLLLHRSPEVDAYLANWRAGLGEQNPLRLRIPALDPVSP